MKEKIKNVFFRVWYWYISTVDTDADVTFMNYGFSRDKHEIDLEEQDKKNRYSAQLYNYVATGVDVKGKDILEVGCGRGGGLSYVKRYLKPNSATGLEINKRAVEFCNEYYSKDNIQFVQGNAESLEFEDNSFDVIINVESSHRYNNMEKFLNEVYRVLKPGGHFLITDFRPTEELDKFKKQVSDAEFTTVKDELITLHVLEALNLSNVEREKLINKMAPKLLKGLGKKFAATEGTPTYNKFAQKEFEYFYHILRK